MLGCPKDEGSPHGHAPVSGCEAGAQHTLKLCELLWRGAVLMQRPAIGGSKARLRNKTLQKLRRLPLHRFPHCPCSRRAHYLPRIGTFNLHPAKLRVRSGAGPLLPLQAIRATGSRRALSASARFNHAHKLNPVEIARGVASGDMITSRARRALLDQSDADATPETNPSSSQNLPTSVVGHVFLLDRDDS